MTIVHLVRLSATALGKEGVLYRCGQNPHNFRLVDLRRIQGDRDMEDREESDLGAIRASARTVGLAGVSGI